MRKTFTRGRAVAAAALAGTIAAAGVAYATIPTNGVISACYTKSGGNLRVIDSSTGSCSSRETSLAWNVQGAQGPAGATGPRGAEGPAGPAGPPGVSGYEVVSEDATRTAGTFTDTNAFSDQIDCPSGKVPVGGGASGSTFKGNSSTGTADLLNALADQPGCACACAGRVPSFTVSVRSASPRCTCTFTSRPGL
jgi:hypothetical protein